jgi:hypothetical protein
VHFKNVSNCSNTNCYSYLETSGGQSSYLYLIMFICSTPMLIRHLWQLKAVVFLHWCLMHAVVLSKHVGELGIFLQVFYKQKLRFKWLAHSIPLVIEEHILDTIVGKPLLKLPQMSN